MSRIFSFFILLIFITGCSHYSGITKRKHRNGFYLSWLQHQSDIQTPIPEKKLGLRVDSSKVNTSNEGYIILNNGDTIDAQIEKIYDDKITYKKLSYLTGPTYSKSLSEVEKVVLKNGELIYTKPSSAENLSPTNNEKLLKDSVSISDSKSSVLVEEYYEEPKTKDEIPDYVEPVNNGNAIVSFIMALISILMLIIGGLGVWSIFYIASTSQGWGAIAFVFLALIFTGIAWLQSLASGLIALTTGIISTIQTYVKENKMYKKDPKGIFGLVTGAFIVLSFLAGFLVLILNQ